MYQHYKNILIFSLRESISRIIPIWTLGTFLGHPVGLHIKLLLPADSYFTHFDEVMNVKLDYFQPAALASFGGIAYLR